MLLQRRGDSGQQYSSDSAIDEQRFGRAADGYAPHFGVENDALRFFRVGRFVDVDVAIAFEMREHRDARFDLDTSDQALAAARHDEIECAFEA